jgi:hypothetical protein
VSPSTEPLSTESPSPDARAVELLAALKAGRWADAEAMFDAPMKAAIPVDRLAAIMGQVTGQAGALQSWTPTEKQSVSGYEVRQFDLNFEHGQLRTVIALTPKLEVGDLRFLPMPPPATLSRQADPAAPYRAEEVKLGTAPFVLSGTLTLPKGAGPYPAVVLVAGSGPQDRDENIGPNHPLRDLAEGLSSKGVVVLRYDKRTLTHGAAMKVTETTVEQEVIADAVAALELLRKRPEVDARRLFVIGHSLGATLAPEIAQRAAPLAGVVMLAPTSRPLPESAVDQLTFLGMPAEKLEPLKA